MGSHKLCFIMKTCLLFLLSIIFLSNECSCSKICQECSEVSISSEGTTSEHLPRVLGTYTFNGTLFNDWPYYRSSNNLFLTPDWNSNPSFNRLTWLVSETLMGFNGLLRQLDGEGPPLCPDQVPGGAEGWIHLWAGTWHMDPQLSVSCSQGVLK